MRSRRRCSRSKAVTARPAAACHYHSQVGWDFVSVARKVDDAERRNRCAPRPSYAGVTATLALVIALGGTSYAVSALPRNSVGTAQIKRHAVTKGKLAKGVAIAGPRGRKGAPGPPGAVRPGSRRFGPRHRRQRGRPAGAATCPAGKRALGGGAHAFGGNGTGALVSSEPTSDGTGWTATAESVMGLARRA